MFLSHATRMSRERQKFQLRKLKAMHKRMVKRPGLTSGIEVPGPVVAALCIVGWVLFAASVASHYGQM